MAGTLTERLQLVVDATTQSAETRFSKLTDAARETGDASVRSAADVATAADRVMAAQAKQADAAGQVLVAERKLQELREGGRASASQLEAAEQKLESQKRKLHLAARDVASAEQQQEAATRQATDATRDAERAQKDYGTGMEGLQGKVKGLLAGGALAAGFHSLTEAAEESYRIGARTENVIRTTGQAAGLSADQVGDLSGAIAAKTGVDDEAIQSGQNLLLTFTNIKNAAGEGNDVFSQATALMTDMSAAMGTDASASAVQLGKALNDPIRGITSLSKVGVSFTAEQKEQIRTLVQSGNVMGAQKIILGELSREFGGAAEAMSTPMDKARVIVGNLAETIGGELLPLVDAGAHLIGGLADVLGAIPTPMGLSAGMAVLLGAGMRSATTEGGLLAGVITGTQTRIAGFTGAVAGATVGTGALATTMGVASVAGRGLVTVLGGPIGIAVLALGAAFTFLNSRTDENAQEAQESTQANQDLAQALKASHGVITSTVRSQAALSAQQEGLLDTAEKTGVAYSQMTAGLVGNEQAYNDTRTALEDYADQLERGANADKLMGTATDAQVQAAYGQAKAVREQIAKYEQLHGTVGTQIEKEQQLAAATDGTTDKQQLATAAMDELKAALEGGGVATGELAKLAGEAADAQVAAALANDQAEAAVSAYRATTDQAVQATLDLISAQLSMENAEYGYLDAMDQLRAARNDATTSVDEVAQAHTRYKAAALDAGRAAADAAVEAGMVAGQVLGPLEEAQVRADAMLANLRDKLNRPGLSEGARADLQGLVDQLQAAKDRGDVQAVVTLTGAPEAAAELDATTENREATVTVESRNGPAVIRYLDTIASTARLAAIRVETRNGPAVEDYLEALRGRERLALLQVETRGGPAVDGYLASLARERLAIIRVETRGGPAVERYLDDLAGNYGRGWDAQINVRRNGAGAPSPTGMAGLMGAGRYGAGGDVRIDQLIVQPQVDSGGRLTQQGLAEAGRGYVAAIRKYERQNGAGWRQDT